MLKRRSPTAEGSPLSRITAHPCRWMASAPALKRPAKPDPGAASDLVRRLTGITPDNPANWERARQRLTAILRAERRLARGGGHGYDIGRHLSARRALDALS